ncbi:MAG: hypothetical protein COX16_16230, partial [Deltaproteobacteria bacterium CG23_combo_of_CG06-09_8_20_14_all_51_20]
VGAVLEEQGECLPRKGRQYLFFMLFKIFPPASGIINACYIDKARQGESLISQYLESGISCKIN